MEAQPAKKLIIVNDFDDDEPEDSIAHKKKSMSSEKASHVKKSGHKNEDDFVSIFEGASKIKGTCKTDVRYKDYSFSLKKVCKRIQFALYNHNSDKWDDTIISKLCKACLEIYPESYIEYLQTKASCKYKLREKMIQLKEHLNKKENLKEYLEKMIFNNDEVNFLVMKDNDNQCIYFKDDVIDVLINNTSVQNSQAIKEGDTPEQKVIIKCKNNKEKFVNLIEIEVRNSGSDHYAELLCVCNRDKLFELLNQHIGSSIEIKNNVILKGKSIEILESVLC